MAFKIPAPQYVMKSEGEVADRFDRLRVTAKALRTSRLSADDLFGKVNFSTTEKALIESVNDYAEQLAFAFEYVAEVTTINSIIQARDIFEQFDTSFESLYIQIGVPEAELEIERLRDTVEDARICLEVILESIPLGGVGQADHIVEPPSLPSIRPAPIQSVVRDDILGVTVTHSRVGTLDYPSANRTREALRRILNDVVHDLRSSSNADRGYIRICERLLGSLATPIEDVSIEDLGVQCQLVERSTRRLNEELGAIVLDQIEHVLAGVGVLLNQFDEWRRFLDEQARTNLDPEDGQGLVARAAELIADLEQPGAPVEPELVRRLRGMVEPVLAGIVGADTVAIPLVCSLSNIFSTLSQHAIDHYQTVSADHGHLVAAGASALLAKFAVDLIEKFCPLLAQYQPLSFILGVVRYLLPLYAMIKDFTS